MKDEEILEKETNYAEDIEQVEVSEEEVEDLLDSFEVPATEEGLTSYLKRISSYPVLSREEEVELARRAKAGDKEAFKKLVESNLRFVVSVASKYKGYGVSLMDLINEGNLGLIQAAKRFDPDRGVRFISYAVWWIKQAIMQALAEQSGVVKLPLKQASVLLKIRNTYEELFQRFGREPTTEEIAEELGMDPEDVEDILRVARIHLSLETPVNRDEEDTTFLDFMEATTPSAEEEAIKASLAAQIQELLSQLNPREAFIIKCRFGIDTDHPMTLEEIGKILGVSRERVRQIEARALQKLKRLASAKKLEDYLN
ncbi:RNA polymerase primary sigma factor [Thermosulfidibacter takaii ABI70S6]|uniref:RNA polymerase primary sigma factor n=1 Tax=Thermosulfidibacter takaii (strain DSM 17441 / JCM 13301 / NBRC 103674 / ABI70S6) TaxID=1298851 RepID=A0A0S3QS95_THET7|nr:RNA polymerase sigma factor RpoD/SigA [Thermosulfidibacter takaii]BAT71175.1 RNA polymerase primary sigma factor [Thermosulfidibacter takaii ABI70S6]